MKSSMRLKNKIVILLIFALILAVFYSTAFAAPKDYYIGIINEDCTISEGPGTGFLVIGELAAGDEFVIVSIGNVWHTVIYNDDYGYIQAKYFDKLDFYRPDSTFKLPDEQTDFIIENPIDTASDSPYYIVVDKEKRLTTILKRGESGLYDTMYMQMVCSTGWTPGRTPVGEFKVTTRKLDWLYSSGYHVFMQNDVQFNNRIYFHSLNYKTSDKNTLIPQSYYDIGEPVSAGCVRLTVQDSLWLRENCPAGTKVLILESGGPRVIDINKVPYLPDGQTYDPTEPTIMIEWIVSNEYSFPCKRQSCLY